ncbi:MAG: hypothetical protein MJ213_03190 [Bacilli bacterium]|nr:hypothetical protein [Bacilli bacterium]
MKKSLLTLAVGILTLGLTSCGPGGGGGQQGTIAQDFKEEYRDRIKEGYFPDKAHTPQFEGTINVHMDFEGRVQVGWQAVADEYMRLQSNKVKVEIHTDLSGSQYSERLISELQNPDTTWDLVEGNLGLNHTRENCIDLGAYLNDDNSYCGYDSEDKIVNPWISTLKSEAYRDYESDTSDEAYIFNSENMQSCWFVNKVALDAAVKQGYKNKDGKGENPITWDDLISLCTYMEHAGYTNPLGITLSTNSIKSTQFTWLLRIYGDYYYRGLYKYIMKGIDEETGWINYDPSATSPETKGGFSIAEPKVLQFLFPSNEVVDRWPFKDVSTDFNGDLYRDFVTNLAKMDSHLMKDATATEFSALRDKFEAQSDKGAPQIILDYEGMGIRYEKKENDNFKLGYFDYPQMIAGKYENGMWKEQDMVNNDKTITRDIGGNGGFISVIKHKTEENQMNVDFVKFFMSPYGQLVYLDALVADGNAFPKGVTTIKDDFIDTPSQFTEFFKKTKAAGVKFNGNIDVNPFISWGVRYLGGRTETDKIIEGNWRGLLLPEGQVGKKVTIDQHVATWGQACKKDAKAAAKEMQWPDEVWTNPYREL